MRYAVLLRGVNVGGVKVKMAVLRDAFADAGFDEVKTLLASGNVLLDSADKPAKVKETAQQVLRDTFGYDAWVLVYDLGQIREIVDGYPFERSDDDKQPYVIFSEDGASAKELGVIGDLDPALEQTKPGPHSVLYWEVTKGETLHSVVGKASSKAKYKRTTTTRNLRTVEKLLT
ncbi:MAG: DUF1697 domain-containing protein [Solirubrobacteraceae bacterium]|nr:DUF1697 domain-containing protein [Solirubrobacteraceae bacterium]